MADGDEKQGKSEQSSPGFEQGTATQFFVTDLIIERQHEQSVSNCSEGVWDVHPDLPAVGCPCSLRGQLHKMGACGRPCSYSAACPSPPYVRAAAHLAPFLILPTPVHMYDVCMHNFVPRSSLPNVGILLLHRLSPGV